MFNIITIDFVTICVRHKKNSIKLLKMLGILGYSLISIAVFYCILLLKEAFQRLLHLRNQIKFVAFFVILSLAK